MAFIPMTIGGGGLVETDLWTNSAPSSSFSAQTVTISDDMNNYDFIGVDYAYSTGTQTLSRSICPVNYFKNGTYNSSTARNVMSIAISNTSNQEFVRTVEYVSDTKIHFEAVKFLGGSGGSNSNIVPHKIVGLKS